MEVQMKYLTRIRLINWHYFENETVCLNGSTLISGENTAGKSTVLDAIQLVLTTNTRKFNTAANEKGNRDLKGYVRCKIGNVGETYLRKNLVISNVALEFYEEKTDKYFVLGVHMTSYDEFSAVTAKWYMEECRLEALSFLNGTKPAAADEFRLNERKIRYIEQKTAAKDRFKRRMGNLEDRFFDIIPKSLAFKPMDNVKDFINKFVLSEAGIDVESLRVNIETLSELEELIEKSNMKLEMLCKIVDKSDEIKKKDKDILVNELLLSKANVDYLQGEVIRIQAEIGKHEQYIDAGEKEIKNLAGQIQRLDESLLELNIAKASNEASRMAEGAERRIRQLEEEISEEKEKEKRLQAAVRELQHFSKALEPLNLICVTKKMTETLLSSCESKEKMDTMQEISVQMEKIVGEIRQEDAALQFRLDQLNQTIEELQKRLRELEDRKLTYPTYTNKLKDAIEKEYKRRGINSKVYIVAELLEVTDPLWQNSVEGYFHTQKFNLIVEPGYYPIALEVYHKNQNKIHTAGIIHTGKLKLDYEINNQSLAYVVHSDNRYAKAYANYILGRVIRSSNIADLENHKIAITADCMLYQGYVVKNLNQETYKDPFIGQNAYRVQIVNVKKELEDRSQKRSELRERKQKLTEVLAAERKVNIGLIHTYLEAPSLIKKYEKEWKEVRRELEDAKKDPTFIEIMTKIEQTFKAKKDLDGKKVKLDKEDGRLRGKIEQFGHDIAIRQKELNLQREIYERLADENMSYMSEAEEKYKWNRKNKSPKRIIDNFSPQKTKFFNEKDVLLNGIGGLKEMQDAFNHKFDQDYMRGMEGMQDYVEAKQQLESVELIRFEEQLRKAKDDCEEVFKNDFLAKMRENIENARNEFRNLNKALDHIYYGEDSYRFIITFDKKKESLYRMIISESNQEGYNLWTQNFEKEYKEEIEELFDKLVTKDDKGQKVIEEYTDYRSYLDYDIEIHKKNGTVQKFSNIYGEKSGSETQVPYYVAIAASFYQLYRLGNSIRIILLDEAFDKMDDERISSMMDFFNSLGLQVILATPPAKVEVIGESVNTILTAIRVGTRSIIEEYEM